MARSAVIDAGLAVKTVLPNPEQNACLVLLEGLFDEGAELTAPALWAYETTSACSKAAHFKHVTVEQAARALLQIEALGVQLIAPDSTINRRAFDWTLRLQRAAAYDSFYLALAERIGADFWTTDRKLVNAVGLPWVRLPPGIS